MYRTQLMLIGLAVVLLALAACGPSAEEIAEMTAAAATDTPVPTDTSVPTQTPPPTDPLEIGDPERGREIYETGGGVIVGGGCIECHSLDGSVKTNVGRAAPSFQGISERAGDRVPELSAVDYLRQSIVDPSAYVVEGFSDSMPKSFRFLLSEEDVDAVVAFLLTQ